MKHFNFLSNFRWFTTVILLITLGIGQMWAGTYSFDLHSVAAKSAGSNVSYWYSNSTCTTHCKTVDGSSNKISSCTLYYKDATITTAKAFVVSVANDAYWFTGSPSKFFIGKSGSTITLPTFSGEKITNVRITTGAASSGKVTFCIKSGSYNASTNTSQTGAASSSFDFPITSTYQSTTLTFTITNANNINITDIIITTEAASSCDANPSIGTASLNGSFNLTTVGVQCASITPGSNCSVASGDYGFIWYANDGTKKEIGGTGVTKVAVTSGAYSSGSFSKNLTGTFVLGNRYSVRAFATNGKPATAYSDTITFQPRSVTFNLNGHGSSTPTTQYVNNGGKATDPSYSESVTGYTFGGWYKEAGCSNSWTFGTDVVSGANKTLYAKWTAKTYTIDLDQDLTPTTAGTTSISVTYNANTNLTSAITKPTKTGWTFAGYYTAKNGGGTQIIDADGNVLASKAGFTDASKNWIGTSDVTLYAKWTCTVTWSVNNLTNVYSAQTLTYNASSTKVASVPGPPSPATYCGDKFMGWTTESDVSQDDDTGLNLFTNVAGSPELKTVGNTTFYAVFADYDE